MSVLVTKLKEFARKHRGPLVAFASALATAVAALIVALAPQSCGSTVRTIVRNSADGTSTQVSVTTNNPTDITVTPSVKMDSISIKAGLTRK